MRQNTIPEGHLGPAQTLGSVAEHKEGWQSPSAADEVKNIYNDDVKRWIGTVPDADPLADPLFSDAGEEKVPEARDSRRLPLPQPMPGAPPYIYLHTILICDDISQSSHVNLSSDSIRTHDDLVNCYLPNFRFYVLAADLYAVLDLSTRSGTY